MMRKIELPLIVAAILAGFALLALAEYQTPTHNILPPTKEIYHLKYCDPIPVDKVRRKDKADI